MSRAPSPAAIKAAVEAARSTRRVNYTAAARALGIDRPRLLALLGLAETRGAPRVHVTPDEAQRAYVHFDSQRAAAKHLRISQGTLRALIARVTDEETKKGVSSK